MKLFLMREWCIEKRQIRGLINTFLLFLMILIFFPLTLPAESILLRQIFSGLVWIALFFSFFLSMEHFFQLDVDAGVIEQWLISPISMHLYLRAKLIVHWITHLLPILCSIPLLMVLFNLSQKETGILILSLLLGSPTLLLFCALAASFSTGLKQKGVLMGLMILPLALPIMILGSGVLTKAMQLLPVKGELALLLALSLFAFLLLPWVMGAALRVSYD